MKTLIYQCWTGHYPEFAKVSSRKFKAYADYIGADYFCERKSLRLDGDNFYDAWYNWLAPIFEEKYQQYDKILIAEMDVYPVKAELENIFNVPVKSAGMALEFCNSYHTHPKEFDLDSLIQTQFEKWDFYVSKKLGRGLARTEKGRFKFFNDGVLILTKDTIKKLHNNITKSDIEEYMKEVYKLDLLLVTYFAKPNHFLHYHFIRLGIDITPLRDTWNYQRSDYDIYTNKSLSSPRFLHLRTATKQTLTEKVIEDYINKLYNDKLVVGCGNQPKTGWINSDCAVKGRTNYLPEIKRAGHTIKVVDLTQPLEFEDNDLAFLYSEHVLEHLPEEVGKSFLKEAYRILKPGGVIRTVVPDKNFYLNLKDDDEYVKFMAGYFKKGKITTDVDYPGIATVISSRCLSVQVSDHHWVPTLDMLIKQHQRAGFKVKVCNYFESEHEELKNLEINDRMRMLESIIVEGTK